MKTLLCRDMIGKRVKLLDKITTNGGWTFNKGRMMNVIGSYNGRFNLRTLRSPKPIKTKAKDGSIIISIHNGVSGVSRASFEVLP